MILIWRYLGALPNTALAVPLLLLVVTRGQLRVVGAVVEAHGWRLVEAILRRCVPIHGGAAAVTFGHIVLGRDDVALSATRPHERAHVRQCEVWGPAFIPAYLIAGIWA
jgi:hypothetical protein